MSTLFRANLAEFSSARKAFVFFTLLGVLFCGGSMESTWARYSPETDWQRRVSAHFSVHYPKSYEKFAEALVRALESGYDILSKELLWEVDPPIRVVVRGDRDDPNGVAHSFPYNRIEIHAVPFGPMSSLGETENWIETLAFHELTHIIANDTTRGLFEIGRSIFGSISKMNPYQPRWLIEGLAVYEETHHTRGGRGHSFFLNSLIRAAVQGGFLKEGADCLSCLSLDRLNSGPPNWPSGLAPYLYGYVIAEVIARKHGRDSLGKISKASAGHLPFLPDDVLNDVAEAEYSEIWKEAVQKLEKASEIESKKIRKAGKITSFHKLTSSGRFTMGADLGPKKKKAYYLRDSYEDGYGLSVVDIETRKNELVSRFSYRGGTRVKSRGPYLIYSRLGRFENYSLFSDAYVWDLDLDHEIQITDGARASDPDGSADLLIEGGKIVSGHLVYVKNLRDGNQAIVIFDGKSEKYVYRGKSFERLTHPTWGRGVAKNWIVFSRKPLGKSTRLARVHYRTLGFENITAARPDPRDSDSTPWVSDDGDVYFSSLRGGISNFCKMKWKEIIAASRKGKLASSKRLTYFEYGGHFPVLISKSFALSTVMGPNGFDIGISTLEPRSERLPKITSVHEKLKGEFKAAPASKEEGKEDSYFPFPSLFPKYWLPFGSVVPEGLLLGVSTSAEDARLEHSYRLLGAWDSRADFPLYDVSYAYDGFYPTIRMSRRQENEYVGSLDQSNRLERTEIDLNYPINVWNVGFFGEWSTSRFGSSIETNGGLGLRFGLRDFGGDPDSIDKIGGERGFGMEARLTGVIVGDEQFPSIEGSVEQRLPSLFDRHFFRIQGSGAKSMNDNFTAKFFVGGGQETIKYSQRLLVRGYPSGVIYGRSIATFNVEYWFPLKDVFGGIGLIPFFVERAKMKIFVDAGSGEFVGAERLRFTKWPWSFGFQVLLDVHTLFHFPFTMAAGFNWGMLEDLGGEKQLSLGIYSGRF